MSLKSGVLFFSLCLTISFGVFASGNIKTNYSGSAGGYILAKPRKASIRGLFFKTRELEIGIGAQVIRVSTESDSVYQTFNQLDSTKDYVFEYNYPSDLRPKLVDSHIIITGIQEVSDSKLSVGTEMTAAQSREGFYSEGSREGSVVAVERWGGSTGLFDAVCNVFVIGDNGFNGKQPPVIYDQHGNQIPLNPNHVFYDRFDGYSIYDEAACDFAERALKSANVVEIDYSEDLVEVWDAVTHVVKSIRVVH
ncbi:MAG: hypothetical protein AB7F43_07500 [Bacteriovoracia bacterium]